MTLGDRIKKVRREKEYTQQALADLIGIRQNSVALIESGKRNASDQVVLAICRELNVNEEWLRYGRGEMFAPAPADALGALVKDRVLSDRERIALEKFLNLKPELREGLIDYFCDVAAALGDLDVPVPPLAAQGASIVEAEAEYEKSSGFAQAMGLSASNTTAATGTAQLGDGKKMA